MSMSVSQFVDDKALSVARRLVEKNVKYGWMVNPNGKTVEHVIRGIIRCGGTCPCGEENSSYQKQCPCSNYVEGDYCQCNLYVMTE